jgi:hypothetical protein
METPHMLMSPDVAAIMTGRGREIEGRQRDGSLKTIERDGRVLMRVSFNDTWNKKFAKLKQRIIDA